MVIITRDYKSNINVSEIISQNIDIQNDEYHPDDSRYASYLHEEIELATTKAKSLVDVKVYKKEELDALASNSYGQGDTYEYHPAWETVGVFLDKQNLGVNYYLIVKIEDGSNYNHHRKKIALAKCDRNLQVQ